MVTSFSQYCKLVLTWLLYRNGTASSDPVLNAVPQGLLASVRSRGRHCRRTSQDRRRRSRGGGGGIVDAKSTIF